jgi:hypothetical protein
MLWVWLSLLTNVTWPPAAIVTVFGLTPFDVIVIVALEAAGEPSEGAVVEAAPDPPPEQAAAVNAKTMRAAR